MPQAAAALSISRSIAEVMTGRSTPRDGATGQVGAVTAQGRRGARRAKWMEERRECGEWGWASDGAFAWCRSAWCGPRLDRTLHARRAIRGGLRFGGGTAQRGDLAAAP